MKNIFKIICLLIVVSLGLSGCKNASLMKRHYNKGYYVSKKHRPSEAKEQENNIVQSKTHGPAALSPFEEHEIKSPELKKDVTLKNDQPSQKIITKKVSSKKENTQPIMNSFSEKHPIAEIKNIPKELKDLVLKQDDVAREALSLLWILIVVLLIIYIIGLLLDLFGLGPVFHLLGVIILILLVLWLLRIL